MRYFSSRKNGNTRVTKCIWRSVNSLWNSTLSLTTFEKYSEYSSSFSQNSRPQAFALARNVQFMYVGINSPSRDCDAFWLLQCMPVHAWGGSFMITLSLLGFNTRTSPFLQNRHSVQQRAGVCAVMRWHISCAICRVSALVHSLRSAKHKINMPYVAGEITYSHRTYFHWARMRIRFYEQTTEWPMVLQVPKKVRTLSLKDYALYLKSSF